MKRRASITFAAALLTQIVFALATDPRAHAQQNPPQLERNVSTRTTQPLRDSLCLNVKFLQGQPLSDLPMLSDLGVRWVRDYLNWRDMEPQPGRYLDLPGRFVERVKYYKDHDIGLVFVVAYGNPQAYPDSESAPANSLDPDAYARYALYIAKQLKRAGVKFKLELWNEPHNFAIRNQLGGNWQGKAPSPWVDHYVKMVRRATQLVKAYDRRIQLFSDDDMWVVHYWFLEAGLPNELDGFAFHPYQGLPELAAVAPTTDWTRPFQVVDEDRSYASAVRRLREQGKRKLGHEPLLWATEWGWPVDTKTQHGTFDEETVATFIPRGFVLSAAAGVSGTCWFSAYDSVDGAMGLKTNAGTERKAYRTYKTLYRELGALRLAQHVAGATHPTTGLQAFLFKAGSTSRMIVWNVEGEATIDLQSAAGRPLTARNMFGDPIQVELLADGKSRIRVGPAPIYIDDATKTMILH